MHNKQSLFWFAAVLLLTIAGPTQAAEYGGIGGRPANPDPGVENSASWFIYQLKPGESKADAAEIQNNSAADVDVLVYAADSIASSDGGFALKQKVDAMTDVGSWVRFYPHPAPVPDAIQDKTVAGLCAPTTDRKKLKITDDQSTKLTEWCAGVTVVDMHLASLEKRVIPFVITVPDQVDVGEHAGGIVIQKKNPEVEPGTQSAVILTTRVGVRIYETVPGAIVRQLALTRFTVTKNPKLPEYTATVGIRNSGNVSVENISTITVTDTLFHRHNTAYTRTMQALPGQELVINSAWPTPRFGHFSFAATVTYQDNGQTRTLKSGVVSIWVVPWLAVGLGGGLIVFLLATWLGYWLWQRRKYSGRGWISYTVRKGEDLATIASRTEVSWKQLARVNGILPPYAIKAGQKLLVPPVKPPQRGSSGRRPGAGQPPLKPRSSPSTRHWYGGMLNKFVQKIQSLALFNKILSGALIAAIILTFVQVGFATTPNPGHSITEIDWPVVTKTGAATLTDAERVVLADATTAAFTITLPTAVVSAPYPVFYIKKIDSSLSNIVTIDGNGSETIDGLANITLANRGETVTLQGDGSNWRVLARRAYDISGYRTKGSTLNQWYTSPNNGTALTTGAGTVNVLRAIPFIVSKVMTIDQMAINVTTAGAGGTGNARVGIYADNGNNYPGALVVDAGAAVTTSTGVKTFTTGLPVTLDPGLYWLAYVHDNATTAPTVRAFAVGSLNPVLGYASTLPTNAQFGWSATFTYAALPATFTAGGSAITAVPIWAVFVRTSL